MFDPASKRFIASIFDVTNDRVKVAVLPPNDPTVINGWRVFTFGFPNLCPDQPLIGLSSDKVAITVNIFPKLVRIGVEMSSWVSDSLN